MITWYEVEIKLYGRSEWRPTADFVGGIEGGFATDKEALEFAESMATWGDSLYQDAEWQIVKCSREVVYL